MDPCGEGGSLNTTRVGSEDSPQQGIFNRRCTVGSPNSRKSSLKSHSLDHIQKCVRPDLFSKAVMKCLFTGTALGSRGCISVTLWEAGDSWTRHPGKLGTVSMAPLEEETWRLRDDKSDSLWLPNLLPTLLSNSSRHSSSGDTGGFCLSLPPLLLSLQNSKRSTQVIPGLF